MLLNDDPLLLLPTPRRTWLASIVLQVNSNINTLNYLEVDGVSALFVLCIGVFLTVHRVVGLKRRRPLLSVRY